MEAAAPAPPTHLRGPPLLPHKDVGRVAAHFVGRYMGHKIALEQGQRAWVIPHNGVAHVEGAPELPVLPPPTAAATAARCCCSATGTFGGTA